MEDLMLHIIKRVAAVKRPADDAPLDLTQTKFLRRICDRLVNHEDLRPGSDLNTESDFDDVSTNSTCQQSCSTLDTSARGSSATVIQVKHEAESYEQKAAPHPFSIDALLGDTKHKRSDDVSTPAVVYSYYTARTPCTSASGSNTSEFYDQVFDRSFWCHACNSWCVDNRDAQGHQYLHGIQGIACNLKMEFFRKHGYVTKHVNIDKEKMQCGLCDRIVAPCFFSKHQRIHGGHFCGICNHEFSSNSRLQDHMNIHTGSTPFSCKKCDRKFAKRSSLTQHQRYHRDHQSFKCSYCHKSFSSKYTRTVHERLHTGDNPFKCQVPGCVRAFPQKIQLQLHMNIHN
ncbi:zinc finger protein ZFP2-like [Mercenaria mercenaria]|uniref:zinc finger protein ZFP2-like n=1 Tax=Mercenaria mercenaria TaxID=6596 RepID=UPI00234E551E|nr:zinc finger protein ZFP2-like [Mercenaria mercenaria]